MVERRAVSASVEVFGRATTSEILVPFERSVLRGRSLAKSGLELRTVDRPSWRAGSLVGVSPSAALAQVS